jgi:serine/threonine-protein kinase
MTTERWRLVERLFHEALNVAPDQRRVFLREACGGDAALQREVESLLAQASAASGFLTSPAADAAATLMTNEHSAWIGRQIGVYRVVSLLGAGGMGEVYRATDTTLRRDVAIKVLPPMFTADADRLARFEREARTLATLNHPNVGAIYGLEEIDGLRALVLELVEGPTLADRIAKGPLPVKESLAIARQIADALDAAHEKGIVHRDLKPANIKITPDGAVKVLDFGLAKLTAVAPGTSDVQTSMIGGTREGIVLGTAAYMSPEQARGQQVDKRTDIWAFGCVLYETLTSRTAFARDTFTDTLAAIIERQPEWTALPASTPPVIERLLRRCLEKDPRRRLRDIGEARIEIEEAMAAPSANPTRAIRSGLATTTRMALWVLVAALTAGAVGWIMRPATSAAPQPVVRLTLPLGSGNSLALQAIAPDVLEISPDGMSVAYVVSHRNSFALYLRALSGSDAKLLAEQPSALFSPFFSPDSRWLAFAAGGKLRKVSVLGGQPVTIADATNFRGGSWGDDGAIVFAPVSRAGLSRVSSEGGTPETVTSIDSAQGETSHRLPWMLPGGKSFLYVVEGTAGKGEDAVWAYSLDSKHSRLLVKGATLPHYARTGHLLYVQGNKLMAAPFDPAALQLTGTPVPVVEGAGTFAVSQTGSLVYGPGTAPTPNRTLVWVDRRGQEIPLAAAPAAYSNPKLSPDGAQILLSLQQQPLEGDLGLYDIASDTLRRLTFDEGRPGWPIWSADGRRITYASNRPGAGYDIFWKPADGTGSEEPLIQKPLSQRPSSWSRDGGLLAFAEESPSGSTIWIFSMKERRTELFSRSRASEGYPSFSPDGRWLAYASNETGAPEIYVRPASGAAGKWRISTGGGLYPLWAASGRELFFRYGDRLLAADVTSEPVFASGQPHLLFEGAYLTEAGLFDYDVASDAQRFLMVKPEPEGSGTTEVSVVQNWFQELKRLVPTK